MFTISSSACTLYGIKNLASSSSKEQVTSQSDSHVEDNIMVRIFSGFPENRIDVSITTQCHKYSYLLLLAVLSFPHSSCISANFVGLDIQW